jgi:hypothetical protein
MNIHIIHIRIIHIHTIHIHTIHRIHIIHIYIHTQSFDLLISHHFLLVFDPFPKSGCRPVAGGLQIAGGPVQKGYWKGKAQAAMVMAG